MGEELDELAPALAGGLLDPPGDAFVRVRSFPSRKCGVGDVARKDVLEDELALAADRRPEARRHELASLQPVEHLVEVAGLSVEKRRHGTRPEHAPNDRRALERPLLIRFEQVDAGRDLARSRGWEWCPVDTTRKTGWPLYVRSGLRDRLARAGARALGVRRAPLAALRWLACRVAPREPVRLEVMSKLARPVTKGFACANQIATK